MKYMVSYQLFSGKSGNKTGSLEEVTTFTRKNHNNWLSFSFFQYEETDSLTHDLKPVELNF